MRPGRNEAGFSLIRMLLVLVVLGGGLHAVYLILPAYSNYWKVQDSFNSVARNLTSLSEGDIRARLPDILQVQDLQPSDLPNAFYDNLAIKKDGAHVEISSSYDVVVWLLGRPADAGSAPHGMEKLQYRGRIDLHFQPYAKTP